MPIYRIVDLNILIDPIYEQTAVRLEPYRYESDSFDFSIEVTEGEISDYIRQSEIPCTSFSAENVIILTKLCNKVLENFNGFFFHSSSLMLDGEAYVFTALSGTGKSTHTALWRRYFGDRVTMINDDKPIIRKHEGSFYIYGTPWMGKSEIGNNIKAPVKAVYILQRGQKNTAVRVKTSEVLRRLFEATLVPSKRPEMVMLLSLFDEFFSEVPVFLLTCNTDIEAAVVAYEAVKTNEKERS